MGTLTEPTLRPGSTTGSLRGSGAVLDALSTLLCCLGRTLLGLDAGFRVIHAPAGLDRLVAPGAAEAARGRSAEALLGTELFGPAGSLRRALEQGQRREDRPAELRLPGLPPRRVSVTVASLDSTGGDGSLTHLVVLRPAADAETPCEAGATELGGLLTRSPAMCRVLEEVRRLAASDAPLLITGEPGTGKERVARALHDLSPRRSAPFGVVDGSTRPVERLASTLFGHAAGACAGARRERSGVLELATSGTVFLAAVDALPHRLQRSLLPILEAGTYERLGERRSRQTGARLVAASAVDLERAVFAGQFLGELLDALGARHLELPPLRERREDVELVSRRYLAHLAARLGRPLWLAPDALARLVAHPWPGNLRELEETLECAVAVCRGQTLHAEDLPGALRGGGDGTPPRLPPEPPGDGAEAAPLERTRVVAALDANRWRREATARSLGISRTTLWRRMRDLDLLD